MSMETLKADLAANLAAVAALNPLTASPQDIANAVKEVWAFIESHVAETDEIDEAVANILENAIEILHSGSAEVFAATATGGLAVAAALKARLDLKNPVDAELAKVCDELTENCTAAKDILEDIVIEEDDEDDDEDEDDEGDAK